MGRCPTCGRILYDKKGFNQKSLKNLTSYGHTRKEKNIPRPVIHKKRCVMDGCKNKRIINSILCIEHYINRNKVIHQTDGVAL